MVKYEMFNFWRGGDVKRLLVLCLAFLFVLGFSPVVKADDGDWVYKSKYGVSFPIVEKLEAAVKTEFRFEDDMSKHYYSYGDAGLYYDWLDWLEVSGNYRYIRSDGGDWTTENRPYGNAKLKWKWGVFKFSDNNRLEYRNREDKDDLWRYRNKLKISYPLKWTKLEISPFASGEIFYDFDASQMNKYRLEGGISMKLIKSLKLNVSYQYDNKKKKGDWSYTNSLCTYLRYSF